MASTPVIKRAPQNNLLRYFDVIKYLESRGIDYVTSGKNVTRGWIEIASPYADDHSYHCGINLSSLIFSDWLSGKKGPITVLIQKFENCSQSQVDKIVEEFTDFTKASSQEINEHRRQVAGTKILPASFKEITVENCPKSVSYYITQMRNYSIDDLIKHECYFQDPFHVGEWKGRLMIPVYNDYELKTFVGRAVNDIAELRYKNFAEEKSILPAKNCIYGIDQVEPNSEILIVEGIFDQWRLEKNGFKNVVSTLGTMTTKEQHVLLKSKKPTKVWVMFDLNAADHAETLARAISFAATETLILSESAGDAKKTKDPDLFTEQDFEDLRGLLNGS